MDIFDGYDGDIGWEPTVEQLDTDTITIPTLTAEQGEVLRLAADSGNGGVRLSGSRRQWRSNARVYAIRGGTVQALVVLGVVQMSCGRLVVTELGNLWLAANPAEAAA